MLKKVHAIFQLQWVHGRITVVMLNYFLFTNQLFKRFNGSTVG